VRLALPVLAAVALFPAPALGQEEGAIRLVLLQQTPTATPEQPLQIRVGAFNDTPTGYQELQLTVAVHRAAGWPPSSEDWRPRPFR
jgi:hypothetical protein